MSFETTLGVMTDVALRHETDSAQSPSGSLFLGRRCRIGTGAVEILHDLVKDSLLQDQRAQTEAADTTDLESNLEQFQDDDLGDFKADDENVAGFVNHQEIVNPNDEDSAEEQDEEDNRDNYYYDQQPDNGVQDEQYGW